MCVCTTILPLFQGNYPNCALQVPQAPQDKHPHISTFVIDGLRKTAAQHFHSARRMTCAVHPRGQPQSSGRILALKRRWSFVIICRAIMAWHKMHVPMRRGHSTTSSEVPPTDGLRCQQGAIRHPRGLCRVLISSPSPLYPEGAHIRTKPLTVPLRPLRRVSLTSKLNMVPSETDLLTL